MKHNDARNSLRCRVMILRKKDFYLASGVALLFVDVHFAHGSVCTADLLGIKAGQRQQDQENQSWHGMYQENLFHARYPTPPATPAQGLMSRCSEMCIKIAKALKEFDGEE
jgi:hypothetical protein